MPNQKPRIMVIGTGGTIGGIGPHRRDYTEYAELGEKFKIQQSLDRIPEIHDVACIESEDLISVGSPAIGPKEWLILTKRINELLNQADISGVVVTHGTATLEETAFFLNLTVKSEKPVVITGAMRPPTAFSTDADLNLIDSIRVAASVDSKGKGVLTVLNNEIHSARDVYKANTLRVDTFRANELGFLGYADSDGEVIYYRTPTLKHTLSTDFDVRNLSMLPRVDIVYAFAGSDSLLLEAVRRNKSDGLVITGFGSGTLPPGMLATGAEMAIEGLPVVLASRSIGGRTVITPRITKLGFLVADNLHPQKARILIMLGLTKSKIHDYLQQMFTAY